MGSRRQLLRCIANMLAANHTDNMETKTDVMQAMMRISAAKNRAKPSQDRTNDTNQFPLEVEKENDTAQKEVLVVSGVD